MEYVSYKFEIVVKDHGKESKFDVKKKEVM